MKIAEINVNGFKVYYIQTKKFKTIRCGIVFENDLNNSMLNESEILVNLITKTNLRYPTEAKMIDYLTSLYDTNLYASTLKNGRVYQKIILAQFINKQYLKDNIDINKKVSEVIYNCLFKPNFNQGFNANENFEQEKELLKNDIQSQMASKSFYAINQFIKIMFKGELYEKYKCPDIKEIDDITIDDINRAYLKMINDDQKYGFIIGDIELDEIKEFFSNVFKQDNIKPCELTLEYVDNETKEIKEVNEIIEEKDSNQSILIFGYRTNILQGNNLVRAMNVTNGMIGGFFHSALFQIVREKYSLAYSINSSYDAKKGYLLIISGINSSDYGKVKELVKEVMENFKKGEFTEENCKMTIDAITNSILERGDSKSTLVHLIQRAHENINTFLNEEESIKLYKAVTIEDIIECSKSLKLDTIYFLKGQSIDS